MSGTVPCVGAEMYRAHQLEHVLRDGRWRCLVCEPEAGVDVSVQASPVPRRSSRRADRSRPRRRRLGPSSLRSAALEAGGFIADVATAERPVPAPKASPAPWPAAVEVDASDPLAFVTDEADVVARAWWRQYHAEHGRPRPLRGSVSASSPGAAPRSRRRPPPPTAPRTAGGSARSLRARPRIRATVTVAGAPSRSAFDGSTSRPTGGRAPAGTASRMLPATSRLTTSSRSATAARCSIARTFACSADPATREGRSAASLAVGELEESRRDGRGVGWPMCRVRMPASRSSAL